MEILTFIIAIIAMLLAGWSYSKIKTERKKNRILQAFIAGIIRSITNYNSKTDAVSPDDVPQIDHKLPIDYKDVLESIQY